MAKTLQQLADYIGTEPEIRSLINETVKYLQSVLPSEGPINVNLPYKEYVALLDQDGTSAPTATVLKNEFEFLPSYDYSNEGKFVFKKNDYEDLDGTKVFAMIQHVSDNFQTPTFYDIYWGYTNPISALNISAFSMDGGTQTYLNGRMLTVRLIVRIYE